MRRYSLESISQIVADHFLPLALESVRVCVEAFKADVFNSNFTFGTHLWGNLSNRVATVAREENSLLELTGKANEYKFKIGFAVFRQHRINPKTGLPSSAKSAKREADTYPLLPFRESASWYEETETIIIGLDANPHRGLIELFIGKLVKNLINDKYEWAETKTIYQAEFEESSEALVEIEAEKEVVPVIYLNKMDVEEKIHINPAEPKSI